MSMNGLLPKPTPVVPACGPRMIPQNVALALDGSVVVRARRLCPGLVKPVGIGGEDRLPLVREAEEA